MSSHLNRQDIIRAATDPESYRDHLAACPDCRLQVELYQLSVGAEALIDAPAYALERARKIARSRKTPIIESLLARLTFDSWIDLAPAGVRGLGPDKERRLRFETDTLRFDLRAEKTGASWTLAAQVRNLVGPVPTFEIIAGAKRIRRRSDDFYIWSAPQPPATIRLVSPEATIVLPEITWNSPRNL